MLRSHVIEPIVYTAHSFDCIEAIEFEGTTIEGSAEVAVAGEVFFLDFKIGWFTAAVVHIVCMVDGISDIQAMLWIVRVPFTHMKLCGFLEFAVLSLRIDSFFF